MLSGHDPSKLLGKEQYPMDEYLRIRWVIDKVYEAAQTPFAEQLEKKVLDKLSAENPIPRQIPLSDHGYEGTKRYKDESEERFNLVAAELHRRQTEKH